MTIRTHTRSCELYGSELEEPKRRAKSKKTRLKFPRNKRDLRCHAACIARCVVALVPFLLNKQKGKRRDSSHGGKTEQRASTETKHGRNRARTGQASGVGAATNQWKRPNQEEIAANRAHKETIKAYLGDLHPDQRRLFTTSGGPKRENKNVKRREKPRAPKQTTEVANPAYATTLQHPLDYLCILDFEATCNNVKPAPRPQEIIEFPTLLFNVRTGQVEDEFHHYIKPT